ncbi:hypothetical protein EYF80_055655 [Liparis tanakae]|uniref:Uncharacterized protein n=1 Tax=Liparis tanakae TaxID=230148 RepID=A0A4Z2EZX2_9TELE|nr:hypothetical protein EYF80_055655 [Liparis tanakae]
MSRCLRDFDNQASSGISMLVAPEELRTGLDNRKLFLHQTRYTSDRSVHSIPLPLERTSCFSFLLLV